MKSFMANPSNIERKWFVVDATDKMRVSIRLRVNPMNDESTTSAMIPGAVLHVR